MDKNQIIDILQLPIDKLELSVRAGNCLLLANIQSVAQILGHTDQELLRIRSFGRTSLKEVRPKVLSKFFVGSGNTKVDYVKTFAALRGMIGEDLSTELKAGNGIDALADIICNLTPVMKTPKPRWIEDVPEEQQESIVAAWLAAQMPPEAESFLGKEFASSASSDPDFRRRVGELLVNRARDALGLTSQKPVIPSSRDLG